VQDWDPPKEGNNTKASKKDIPTNPNPVDERTLRSSSNVNRALPGQLNTLEYITTYDVNLLGIHGCIEPVASMWIFYFLTT
jgi:hypothetical protein